MKLQTLITTATSAATFFSSVSSAQTVQSKPFKLLVTTSDGKYNSSGLEACHVGAGIESLCLGYGAAAFNLNTTQGQISGVKNDGIPGVLTWELRGGNFNESQGMSFSVEPTTNVALPLFAPSGFYQYVAFDRAGYMNIQSYLNDTVSPPTDGNGTAYYRWYVCRNNYSGYMYTNLNWALGRYQPQNPSCVKAKVKRVFLPPQYGTTA